MGQHGFHDHVPHGLPDRHTAPPFSHASGIVARIHVGGNFFVGLRGFKWISIDAIFAGALHIAAGNGSGAMPKEDDQKDGGQESENDKDEKESGTSLARGWRGRWRR